MPRQMRENIVIKTLENDKKKSPVIDIINLLRMLVAKWEVEK